MHYSIKIGDQTYSVEIEDLEARPVKVMVDGETLELWPEDISAQAAPVRLADNQPARKTDIPCKPEPAAKPVNSSRSVCAPIPGVIIEIDVKAGQAITRGDTLCILEAMKMKNAIRAGRDGVIGSIQIDLGDQVRHGQSLMEFTE
ncbi:MAG: biotin/lipoyl-binding protein [Leptolinea sp.]|jgi:biotin carboxyl carrier protein|nr:biotin/lipoyl-binding protein [Leptolinea sp.]